MDVNKDRREYYWKNTEYRDKRIVQCKDYYYNNPEYFSNYREENKDKIKAYMREKRQTPEHKAYIKNYREENKYKVRAYVRKYANKPEVRAKKRLHDINKTRIKRGLEPVVDVETHFQQRKEEWFKRIYFAHRYKEIEDDSNRN